MNPDDRHTLKKIVHIDMDAFFASVEQRDFPEFREKPLVVGGDPAGRGVVAAASYEARLFGIRSAMPSAVARRLCPHAIFIRPRFEVYREVSREIRRILREYTPLVEPLSLDEAYLDVTDRVRSAAESRDTSRRSNTCPDGSRPYREKGGIYPSATRIALEIRRRIRQETGLTASAGISFNKFLAKMASDVNKPDGYYVIPPSRAGSFIDNLEIGRFHGIGRATEEKMKLLGIHTGRDLRQWQEEELVRHFGKAGHHYYRIVRGIDNREVTPHRERKSVGREKTFATDLSDLVGIREQVEEISKEVSDSLLALGRSGKTVTLKVRYDDFETITRSITFPEALSDGEEIAAAALGLVEETEAGSRKIRLLGVTLSSLSRNEDSPGRQLELEFPTTCQR